MVKEPMLFFPYNFCPNCKTTSIEIYSWHNYGQHYSKLLDQYELNGTLPASMDKYGIYTMRCNRCGKEYKIVWEDGIPKPIHGKFYTDLFSSIFRDNSLKGRPHIIDNGYIEKLKEN